MIFIPIWLLIFVSHVFMLGVFFLMTYISAVENDPVMFWIMIALSYWWYVKGCPIFRHHPQQQEEDNGEDSQ